MADEPIIAKLRPGFPKDAQTDSAFVTSLEYVGLVSDLEDARPAKNAVWGDYPGFVSATNIEPFEMLDSDPWGILSVTVEKPQNGTDYGFDTGTKTNTDYEIDWVDVATSPYQHPEFAIGGSGAYALTSKDIASIELWKEEKDPDVKAAYQYSILSASGETTTSDLSANAKMFARGIELGIESYPLKMPVARRSETWVDGPPETGSAGLKETPASFPNLPTGYEWLREADRSLKQGGARKWNRDIEWTGAVKVYIDAAHIYWSPPA